jgi:UDP-2,3-diacylglucosamine hydrolase
MIRPLLRNPMAIRSFRWLHPDLATRLAVGSSNASRSYAARDGGRGLRAAAIRAADADPALQLLVFGHSHVATIERLPRGAAYGNAGSWLDAPTYLHVTTERVALRRWEDSAESADLHALYRSAEEPLA